MEDQLKITEPTHVFRPILSAIKEVKEEVKRPDIFIDVSNLPWVKPSKHKVTVPHVRKHASEVAPSPQKIRDNMIQFYVHQFGYIPEELNSNNNNALTLGFEEPVNPDVDLQWMKDENRNRYARFAETVLHGGLVSEVHIQKIEDYQKSGTPYRKPRLHDCLSELLSLAYFWDYDDAVSDISSVTCDTYEDAEEYLPDL